jgi:hypothetical protein
MITETEIITALSGSILGDYPIVLTDSEARKTAVDLFKKILDIDNNGAINSILFYSTINANPTALALTQRTKLETATADLNSLRETLTVGKVPYILNPDLFTETPIGVTITPELRATLISERQRLTEIFKLTANVPTILSISLT